MLSKYIYTLADSQGKAVYSYLHAIYSYIFIRFVNAWNGFQLDAPEAVLNLTLKQNKMMCRIHTSF